PRYEVDGCRPIAPEERAASGYAEPLGRPAREYLPRLVDRAHSGSAAKGLLEVVPEDLLILRGMLSCLALQPGGVPLMELRPRSLGNRLVGGVADQQVVES